VVRRIGRNEFNRLIPYTGEFAGFIGEGAEWFTDDTGSVAGLIGRRRSESGWRFVVLKRTAFGDYRVCHLSEAIADLSIAGKECCEAMASAATAEANSSPEKFFHHRLTRQSDLQEKPRGGMKLVGLIVAADALVIATLVVLFCHWF